jgi:hypothetical protein
MSQARKDLSMADVIRLYRAAGVWMAEFSDGTKAPTPYLEATHVWEVAQAISRLNPGSMVFSQERN